ncbi:MAG: hypothetical protein R3A10_22935 [Caldilineaceae bacterium]
MPASLERPRPARAKPVRELARHSTASSTNSGAPRPTSTLSSSSVACAHQRPGLRAARAQDQSLLRRYIDAVWNRAKPAANYDVSDRLAVYAIAIDSWPRRRRRQRLDPRSQASSTSRCCPPRIRSASSSCAPIHGIGRHDLDSMRRYRGETPRASRPD